MPGKIVLFAEEDTQFRLMETALNGTASDVALKAWGLISSPYRWDESGQKHGIYSKP